MDYFIISKSLKKPKFNVGEQVFVINNNYALRGRIGTIMGINFKENLQSITYSVLFQNCDAYELFEEFLCRL